PAATADNANEWEKTVTTDSEKKKSSGIVLLAVLVILFIAGFSILWCWSSISASLWGSKADTTAATETLPPQKQPSEAKSAPTQPPAPPTPAAVTVSHVAPAIASYVTPAIASKATPAVVEQPQPKTYYYVVIGTFNQQDYANTLKNTLHSKLKIASEIVKTSDNKYAVYVGKYESNDSAEIFSKRFKKTYGGQLTIMAQQ
ncbi:MAG: SPOR domain-containing protein, partial [Prevotellaceae bacterium]|nr:SPOR domain-containing protein [Prevotellaceae bacterium]